jgi:hypothetical protein
VSCVEFTSYEYSRLKDTRVEREDRGTGTSSQV